MRMWQVRRRSGCGTCRVGRVGRGARVGKRCCRCALGAVHIDAESGKRMQVQKHKTHSLVIHKTSPVPMFFRGSCFAQLAKRSESLVSHCLCLGASTTYRLCPPRASASRPQQKHRQTILPFQTSHSITATTIKTVIPVPGRQAGSAPVSYIVWLCVSTSFECARLAR